MRQPVAIIHLTDDERRTLERWTRRGKSEYRLVERAKVILMAHEGRTNQQIATALKTRTARVSKWRQRFGVSRLAGLNDAARSGKPATYDLSTENECWLCSTRRPPKAIRNGMARCWRKPCRV